MLTSTALRNVVKFPRLLKRSSTVESSGMREYTPEDILFNALASPKLSQAIPWMTFPSAFISFTESLRGAGLHESAS